MIHALLARCKQGYRTTDFPDRPPALPDRFRGRPVFDPTRCAGDCRACAEVCPTGALGRDEAGAVVLDLGRCLFCGACARVCQSGALRFSADYRMAVSRREDLRLRGSGFQLAQALEERSRRIFGRSLKLREVSAGGCNACEADTNVLNTLAFDLGRFGIQFVASPRHADGLLITGPVTRNMEAALRRTYAAVPTPRIVIAVGACAIAGGPYRDRPEVCNGAPACLPVDLFVPGCPPNPWTILDGLLRLLGRLESGAPATA